MESVKLMVITDAEGKIDIVTTCGKKVEGLTNLSVSRGFDEPTTITLTAYAYDQNGRIMIS